MLWNQNICINCGSKTGPKVIMWKHIQPNDSNEHDIICVLNLGNMNILLASKRSWQKGLYSKSTYPYISVISVVFFCDRETSQLCPSFACQSFSPALRCEWEYVTNKNLGITAIDIGP